MNLWKHADKWDAPPAAVAVAPAGVEQAVARGEIQAGDPVGCLVTGSGFKDERSLIRMTGEEKTPLVDGFAAFASAVRDDLKRSVPKPTNPA